MITFCNYHRHSMYTNVRISDSAVTNRDYAIRAKELGHKILSSVEHGWQGNYFDVIKLAKEYGLKPVIGAEVYWVKDRTEKDRNNCHMCIIAKNENGRQALNDILSEANITGFYGQPRVDIPLILSLPKDDVIVTTACLAYWKYTDIIDITKQFAEHFGENFFLEVQYHNTDSQRKINKLILKLKNELNIPIIMGCDSHYIKPEDAQTRVDFLYSKGLEYPDEEGWYLDYPDGDTAYQRFATQCVLSHSEILEAINNTNVMLTVEEYNSPVFNDEIKLPSLHPDWTQEERDEEYKRLVWNGWDEYKKDVPESEWGKYIEEIKKEIQTVVDTHMSDYFICDYYIMKRGKENGGKLTKSGRGSGASFFTNTLLGFSDVDRISASVHMYPERFMSTTRILQSKGIPDIDMNEAPTEPFVRAQAEVLGQDHSYPMVAYGTMKNSAAWKLYAKSQGVPFEIANAVSEQIRKYENAVKHADEDEKDDIDINDYIDTEYKDIYAKSKGYLGLITSWSIAPCSSLIYMGSIRKEIGLVKVKDNICCLLDGHIAEEGHFLKNDHLKVSVVDLIYKSYRAIGIDPPKVKDLLKMCPPEDSAWDIFEKGCTIGINQCEKDGTRARVMKYKPRNISELSAFVAAIRPSGASYYKKFESREPFSYGVKAFDDLIQTKEFPYSFLLYQEQIMRALNYAGIDMAECYTAIKNIAKKRAEKVLAYRDTFVKGFQAAIIRDEGKSPEYAATLAENLWKIIEDAAGYGFNASHSYCVALDALYGAWLKAHHPLAFYETYLTLMEEKGDKDKMNALKEEAESYFKINFPPFRFGTDNRKIKADISNNAILNSISSIKGYSSSVGAALYDCGKQEFDSFVDALKWLDDRSIKRAKIQPLIVIDYFQKFGNINELLSIIDFWDFLKQGQAKSVKKDKVTSPILKSLFDTKCSSTKKDGSDASSYKVEDAFSLLYSYEKYILSHHIKEPTMKERIAYDMDVLGYADVVTNKEEDRRRLLITDVVPLSSNDGTLWSYRIGTKSLGSGKTARLTVKKDVFEKNKIAAGDIIYAAELFKNKSGYWYLLSYTKEE